MPLLSDEQKRRYLGPVFPDDKCDRCGKVHVRHYCRSCDEFFVTCGCPMGAIESHEGHRIDRGDVQQKEDPKMDDVASLRREMEKGVREAGEARSKAQIGSRTEVLILVRMTCPECGKGPVPLKELRKRDPHGFNLPGGPACCGGIGVERELSIYQLDHLLQASRGLI